MWNLVAHIEEESRLRLFVNRVLRRIFRSRRRYRGVRSFMTFTAHQLLFG